MEGVRRAKERRVKEDLVGLAEVEGWEDVGRHCLAIALAALCAHGGRCAGRAGRWMGSVRRALSTSGRGHMGVLVCVLYQVRGIQMRIARLLRSW